MLLGKKSGSVGKSQRWASWCQESREGSASHNEGVKAFSSFKNLTATPCLSCSTLLITAGPVRVKVSFCPVNSGGKKSLISACSFFRKSSQEALVTKAPPWDKSRVTPSTSSEMRVSLIFVRKLLSVLVYFLLSKESMPCPLRKMKQWSPDPWIICANGIF
jgi:hypothetical protein